MTIGYEVSGTYLGGLAKATRALGYADALLPALDDGLRAALERPNSKSWWPAALSEQLLVALDGQAGLAAVEAVGRHNVKHSMGPIVMPLVKVMLAISRNSPDKLFEKMAQFSSTAVRGIDIHWKLESALGGLFSALYPHPQAPAQHAVWRGGLQAGFDIVGRQGTVTVLPPLEGGKLVRLQLAWT